jgi:hypothetical protein
MVVIGVTLVTLARPLPRLPSGPITIEHGQKLRRGCSCQHVILWELTPCSRSRHPIIVREWGLLREAWWVSVLRCAVVYGDCLIYVEYCSIPSSLLSCAPLVQVISMVVDGSNRQSVIWLGVDAVITTSLPINSTPPIQHHTSYHTLLHPTNRLITPSRRSQGLNNLGGFPPNTMSTPLLQQFPSLSGYPTSFLKDLLSSPQLVEAYLFTLPQIQELAAEVERLSKENEDLASEVQDIVELTFRG